MFHSSKKNSETSFGLDISDQSLKIVQLKKHSDKIKMQSFGKYNLKKGIIEKGEIKNEAALIEAIKALIAKPIFGSITTNNVVTCLPENQSFIKLISVENSPNQISDLVSMEVEKFFPFALNKLYFDWQIIKKHTDSFDILVSAAPKDMIDSYIHALKIANLSVLAMETESISLCRALIKESPKQAKHEHDHSYAIVDIGAVESIMVIYSADSIVMSMGIDVSGEDITEHIATTLEINHSQAEKAKIICGLDKDKAEGIIYDIIIGETTKISNRIKDIINFYQDHYPSRTSIEKIFISGGGSNIKHLKKIIANHLNIEVLDGDVFMNIDDNISDYGKKLTKTHNLDSELLKRKKKSKNQKKKTETISSKHNSSLNYATVIGLALRDV